MATTDEKKWAKTSASGPDSNVNEVLEKPLDFGDLKPAWDKLRERPGAESNLFRVTTRLAKLDPIATLALANVKKAFPVDQEALRKLITGKGWATELDRVIKRINALRISENKRVILAAVYPSLLKTLLCGEQADREVKDDAGLTEALLFEFERENGPVDRFAQEVVKLVGAKHRINFSADNVLRDLIAHQVRAGL